ncbi:hypothetical protein, partial [Pseudarthrobacter sp. NamE5]|uniref:hypothetical protein n=1 Tax=Pseudarthrobacter sp. NamE5 TaxID=2576839 RepID=UPI00110A4835
MGNHGVDKGMDKNGVDSGAGNDADQSHDVIGVAALTDVDQGTLQSPTVDGTGMASQNSDA